MNDIVEDQPDTVVPTTTIVESKRPKDYSTNCVDIAESAVSGTAKSAVPLINVLTPLNYVKKLVWRGKIVDMHRIQSFTVKAFAVSGRIKARSWVSCIAIIYW